MTDPSQNPSVSATPKQIVATGYGGPEMLALVDMDMPIPGPGEVVIAVRAAGVNPVDYKMYNGYLGTDVEALPLSLGWEAAGVVVAAGSDAVGRAGLIEVGDEVIAYPVTGGHATHVTALAKTVVPKPADMSFESAAGLLLVGSAAVHALTAAGVVKNTVVLIHGVAGGVGHIAAQIALADGARVIGTAHPRHHAALAERGVIPLAYGDGLLERVREAAPEGIDAAIDTVGTDEAIDVSLALVNERRLIVSAAGFHRVADGITLIGFAPGVDADAGDEIRDAARLRLTALVTDGLLDVTVARTFPLSEASAAHALVIEGHAGGKVVLVP